MEASTDRARFAAAPRCERREAASRHLLQVVCVCNGAAEAPKDRVSLRLLHGVMRSRTQGACSSLPMQHSGAACCHHEAPAVWFEELAVLALAVEQSETAMSRMRALIDREARDDR